MKPPQTSDRKTTWISSESVPRQSRWLIANSSFHLLFMRWPLVSEKVVEPFGPKSALRSCFDLLHNSCFHRGLFLCKVSSSNWAEKTITGIYTCRTCLRINHRNTHTHSENTHTHTTEISFKPELKVSWINVASSWGLKKDMWQPITENVLEGKG